MSIEIEHEPTPPPRPSGLKVPIQEVIGGGVRMRGGAHIQFVEEATGKIVNEVITPDYVYENERRTRHERKY